MKLPATNFYKFLRTLSILTAILLLIFLAIWLFSAYKVQKSNLILETVENFSNQTIHIQYPPYILWNTEPSHITLSIVGRGLEKEIKITLPEGLVVHNPEKYKYQSSFSLVLKESNQPKIRDETIDITNQISGMNLFPKRLGILLEYQENSIWHEKNVEIKAESFLGSFLRELTFGAEVNEKSPVVVIISGLLVFAGGLYSVVQSKLAEERSYARKKFDEEFSNFKREYKENHIDAIRNAHFAYAVISNNVNWDASLIQKWESEPELGEHLEKYIATKCRDYILGQPWAQILSIAVIDNFENGRFSSAEELLSYMEGLDSKEPRYLYLQNLYNSLRNIKNEVINFKTLFDREVFIMFDGKAEPLILKSMNLLIRQGRDTSKLFTALFYGVMQKGITEGEKLENVEDKAKMYSLIHEYFWDKGIINSLELALQYSDTTIDNPQIEEIEDLEYAARKLLMYLSMPVIQKNHQQLVKPQIALHPQDEAIKSWLEIQGFYREFNIDGNSRKNIFNPFFADTAEYDPILDDYRYYHPGYQTVDSPRPTLIYGETGSGKTAMAQWLADECLKEKVKEDQSIFPIYVQLMPNVTEYALLEEVASKIADFIGYNSKLFLWLEREKPTRMHQLLALVSYNPLRLSMLFEALKNNCRDKTQINRLGDLQNKNSILSRDKESDQNLEFQSNKLAEVLGWMRIPEFGPVYLIIDFQTNFHKKQKCSKDLIEKLIIIKDRLFEYGIVLKLFLPQECYSEWMKDSFQEGDCINLHWDADLLEKMLRQRKVNLETASDPELNSMYPMKWFVDKSRTPKQVLARGRNLIVRVREKNIEMTGAAESIRLTKDDFIQLFGIYH